VPVPVFFCLFISGFPLIKRTPKIPEKSNKKSVYGNLLEPRRRARGGPPGLQAPWWRGPRGRHAKDPSGSLVDPLGAPLCIYIALAEETPKIEVIFPISSLYRRRRRFQIKAARRSYPSTLPEGGSTSGRPSIAMDYGSMTSSYVMFSSPLCASTFDTS